MNILIVDDNQDNRMTIELLLEDIDGLEKEENVNEVKTSPLVNKDSKITFKRSDSGFTFVNFNFETK